MLRSAVALALLVVLMGVTGARQAHGGGFILVDTTLDLPASNECFDGVPDGDCSLRGAIVIHNANPGLESIFFVLGSGVPTIVLSAPLPAIAAAVIMDGAIGGATRVNINGASAGADADGLHLVNHSGSTIRNMVINGFADGAGIANGAGIAVTGGGSHTIQGNLIGTNSDGTQAIANFYGIYMEDTTNNTIGGNGDDHNIISGNTFEGVRLRPGATNNTIAGNTIGLSKDWSTALPNGSGVGIFGSGNKIGLIGVGLGNVIAGNVNGGVAVSGGGNTVQANFIGTNPLGQAKPNGLYGVGIGTSNGETNTIGGSLMGANIISGNHGAGVDIEAPANVDVSGNVIGLSPSGTALPNGRDGVEVTANIGFASAGTTGIEIGKLGAPNTIAGNGDYGVQIIDVDGVTVRANNIGVNQDQTDGFMNLGGGISIDHGDDNIIDGNFIAGHFGVGIDIDGRGDSGAIGNEIMNNFVGGTESIDGNTIGMWIRADNTDVVNNTIVRNGNQGIFLSGDSNRAQGNTIGRAGIPADGNGEGIRVEGDGNIIGDEPDLTGQDAEPQGDEETNEIWDNVGAGVIVADGSRNTISRNSIGQNGGIGIDLLPAGITPNDPDDPDEGANDLQNFPVLTSANVLPDDFDAVPQGGGGTFVEGSLNSTPDSDFVLEFFANDSCNQRSGGEYEGSAEVTTDSNGDVQFTVQLISLPVGEFVSATARSENNSTSEFSACILTTGPTTTPTPSPTPSPGPTGTPTPTPSPTDVRGDADCDGDVDTDDVIAVLTEVAGVPPGAACENNVDCGDPIDDQDALDILKYVAAPADFPLPPC